MIHTIFVSITLVILNYLKGYLNIHFLLSYHVLTDKGIVFNIIVPLIIIDLIKIPSTIWSICTGQLLRWMYASSRSFVCEKSPCRNQARTTSSSLTARRPNSGALHTTHTLFCTELRVMSSVFCTTCCGKIITQLILTKIFYVFLCLWTLIQSKNK